MEDKVKEVLVYAEEGVITAEIFPNSDAFAGASDEDIAASMRELINRINKSLPSAKTIRKIRIRKTGFDKTTSKKIRRNQTEKGETI